MSQTDLNPLFQQMGALLSSIDALRETIAIRQSQAEQLHDILRSDLAILRGDQGDLEEKLDCVICIMQHDLEALRCEARSNAQAIDTLVSVVQSLRKPLADIAALRARVGALVLSAGAIGTAAMWLAEPFYRWLVDGHLSRR